MVLRLMHMSLRSLHKLMDLNMTQVLLVIRRRKPVKAENAVKLYKCTLTKVHHSGQDGYLALLELRNTPSEIFNSSPAQTVRKKNEDTCAYCQIPVETFRCANWTWSTREEEKAGTLL